MDSVCYITGNDNLKYPTDSQFRQSIYEVYVAYYYEVQTKTFEEMYNLIKDAMIQNAIDNIRARLKFIERKHLAVTVPVKTEYVGGASSVVINDRYSDKNFNEKKIFTQLSETPKDIYIVPEYVSKYNYTILNHDNLYTKSN